MILNFLRGRKSTVRPVTSLNGFTDWHCHILPGVDDGVSDMGQTLEILRQYEEEGVAEVWFTPHIMEDMPNTPEMLRERFKEVLKQYSGTMKLHLGAENMMDTLFEERLESGDLLPIGPESKQLLVETSYFNPPMGMKETLKKIREKGFQPVLAHPERYAYMDRNDYRSLKNEEVSFQVNLLSFSGYYGKEAKDRAIWLYQHNMYDLLGTDLHHVRMLEHLKKTINNQY